MFEGMFDRPQMVRLTGGLKGGNLEGGIVAAQGSVREGVGMDLFLGIFFFFFFLWKESSFNPGIGGGGWVAPLLSPPQMPLPFSGVMPWWK